MDATASREPSWDQACQIQGEMFTETAALGGLEVQLLYYRGFGECRASRWAASAADLLRLMTSVRCLGGQTQIRWITAGGTGMYTGMPPEAHFGLGAATEVDRLEVLWPDGAVSRFEGVEPDQLVTVTRENAP